MVTVMYWRPTSQLCGQWLASLRWMAAGEYYLVRFPPLQNLLFTLSFFFCTHSLSYFFSLSLSCNLFSNSSFLSLSPSPSFLSFLQYWVHLPSIFLLSTVNLSLSLIQSPFLSLSYVRNFSLIFSLSNKFFIGLSFPFSLPCFFFSLAFNLLSHSFNLSFSCVLFPLCIGGCVGRWSRQADQTMGGG